MPTCIKCGTDAGIDSVICMKCDDRPGGAIGAQSEDHSRNRSSSRSDSPTPIDNSPGSHQQEQDVTGQHDPGDGPSEKKESMLEAFVRLEHENERKENLGGVLKILSLLFGGFSGR